MKERQVAAVLMVMLKLASGVVLMTDPAMTRLVIISDTGPMCSIYTNRPEIRRLVLEADPRLVREVNPLDMGAVVDSCRRNGLTKHGRRHSTQPMQQGGFIYPGTKWCGPGNIASDFDDLGEYQEEDRCCRDHDSCPEQLAPGQCLYGLCNESPFTRSHCDCDTRFKRCLQSLNTDTANTLGAIFFNVAQITCFTEAKPCPQQYLESCRNQRFRSVAPYVVGSESFEHLQARGINGIFAGFWYNVARLAFSAG